MPNFSCSQKIDVGSRFKPFSKYLFYDFWRQDEVNGSMFKIIPQCDYMADQIIQQKAPYGNHQLNTTVRRIFSGFSSEEYKN